MRVATGTRIGTRIRLRRQELLLTQAQLAARIGVHVSTVTNWEADKHFPARYQGAVEAALGIKLSGEPEEVYTDPLERQIWEEADLPKTARREIIGHLRRARREHARRTETPPA